LHAEESTSVELEAKTDSEHKIHMSQLVGVNGHCMIPTFTILELNCWDSMFKRSMACQKHSVAGAGKCLEKSKLRNPHVT